MVGGDASKGSEIAYTEFTLWLTPREPLRTELLAMIRRLASDLGAVEFEPHVTLFCGPSDEAEARATAEEIAAHFQPIDLSVDRIECTDRFTKTLFIQFQDSQPARRMHEAVRDRYSHPSGYVFSPHLSLLYKKLPKAQQMALCRSVAAPTGIYFFDRIRTIETELPIEGPGPVRRWKALCDFPLVGS